MGTKTTTPHKTFERDKNSHQNNDSTNMYKREHDKESTNN